ncbi:hypothetical protein CEXT_223911 [Caerostris extrusa]|uniref:Uncharacterized protein n=1 Tax=Caerostris extrusa TaxID=172846 RepID=A0AAV4MXI8_CAEEX|nr:hypothetical protein CEXT_223911 [Caerostris extrusa]
MWSLRWYVNNLCVCKLCNTASLVNEDCVSNRWKQSQYTEYQNDIAREKLGKRLYSRVDANTRDHLTATESRETMHQEEKERRKKKKKEACPFNISHLINLSERQRDDPEAMFPIGCHDICVIEMTFSYRASTRHAYVENDALFIR